MNENELEEMMRLLEEQGWRPMACDTPVTTYEMAVRCGKPTGIGNMPPEMRMLPSKLLSWQPEFTVQVQGDSMSDVDIIEGDHVLIRSDHTARDGDIVLTFIDDEFTLKTFCHDEDGRPWLVPQNKNYKAFPLEEYQNVWIVGVVTSIIKDTPRISYTDCMKQVWAAKQEAKAPREVTREEAMAAIKAVAPMVKVGRHWYAVYRAMVDRQAVTLEDYDGFVALVKEAVPEHENLPKRDELQRLAVQSFAKPVAQWNPLNAPVKGKRFNDYLMIAERTLALLDM